MNSKIAKLRDLIQIKVIIFFTFLLLLFYSSLSFSQPPWQEAVRGNWREMETAKMLPPFCGTNPRYKNQRKSGKWKGASHLNHLCEDKAKVHICYRYFGKQKNECLRAMSDGAAYAIRGNKDPNHPLLPYLYVEHGKMMYEVGDYSAAVEAFNTAIKKNPKYISGYVRLADVYMKSGEYNLAKALLIKAKKIKDKKSIRRRLSKLDELMK